MAGLIVPVILAGGQGTRLWPMSRAARPKQFLELVGSTSLFQAALLRVSDRSVYSEPLVITNIDYRFIVAEQAVEVQQSPAAILLEPMSRNTALAIAIACLEAVRQAGEDAIVHVLPSDHEVQIDAGYAAAVQLAAEAARDGSLVTFGVAPTEPETCYGYVSPGEPLRAGCHRVARFVEKPNRARAEEMLSSGKFLWNSGMFMLGASQFLLECEKLAPVTFLSATRAMEQRRIDADFVRLDETGFTEAPNVSVDIAIFERTNCAAVVPVSFGWSDLGSWAALWKVADKDGSDNVSRGGVTLSNVSHSLVVTDRAHVAVEGLEDVAVIASEDAIYVGRLSEAQKVGDMVQQLRGRSHTAALTQIHRTSYRPWGGYSSLVTGERFQVKRLFVKPGRKLSLQRHHHRSEHWIVVRGTAEVTLNNEVQTVTENQSVYLPLGCTHRLANPGKILLELIEVQTGSYLGEDDITRLDDEFGRA
ncbi:mannose-1-phosphate guanylyltransferase/mannose-6-phosphate isomerase [Devosia sp. 1566]|uniref:mannose-1-phosphate guanylyltransferase/mannose-6-phosphate isomerase n=1 Tax=Devosia sp. 1566 TaxID=2499144 RepID=UPI000FDCD537|nr:mannose-1-phosphate guanylyltransferase/mannose-6-phosphate isomerase [Devosia sp. 1566]